ncbi:S66 family peptidase [Natronobacterium gregoryi]|uniref:LD-carboxypeptidase n=2 Tax=Natronobacterium gregoryi TaxID=44930 RepID=L0ALH5_NATGS|nr:S66 peptidase family protein [Natronobacterium gregoryi]AFZ74304.1 putative MccF-like protein (microcin C7 resistance) [Natronobacterium gregoryi SP2]ELY63534.1 peptidase U61 [Natronobacterium gregoryi SP2]PLK22187.1 LD-carboxypeptidase [Natronobacterium gregoryi SP2]SFI53352.1 Muramoyltetrapeptide carboxypeptidase LdcA (peptidoglycan recycling) [Natronobacterium gregoryi]
MGDLVTPPSLERGSQVAVVAPSSNPTSEFPHVYELGLERLRAVFDLEPVEYPTVSMDQETLANDPEARAKDVMDAFEDPEIDGVITVIGGNVQIKILEHLEPEILRENPTRFYGYSDSTNLALYLWNLGIVSYYGPTVMVELGMDGHTFDHTVEYTERAFFEESFGEIRPAERFTDEPGDWIDPDSLEEPRETELNPGWQLAGGDDPVEGRLWGGCLEVLDQQFLAERYLPDEAELEGTILALETAEELPEPTWVEGVLQALGERGLLERFAGVLVGRPASRSHLEDRPPERRERYREQQRDAITGSFAEYNPDAPIVFDVDFGHTWPTTPIPIGSRVEIEPEAATIRFE